MSRISSCDSSAEAMALGGNSASCKVETSEPHGRIAATSTSGPSEATPVPVAAPVTVWQWGHEVAGVQHTYEPAEAWVGEPTGGAQRGALQHSGHGGAAAGDASAGALRAAPSPARPLTRTLLARCAAPPCAPARAVHSDLHERLCMLAR